MFAVVLALLAVLSFETARWTTPVKTVHLIGTPIERLSNSEDDAQADDSSASSRTGISGPGISRSSGPSRSVADSQLHICGAPTKSGRPCQRRAKHRRYSSP